MTLQSKSIALAAFVITLLGIGAQTVYASSYTPAQVAVHNTAADCWATIDGKVYNLTTFIAQHSGGQAAIIGVCGKDGTASFNSGPHNGNTLNTLAPLLLGNLTTSSSGTGTVTTTPPQTDTVITPTQTITHEDADHEDDGDQGENEPDGDQVDTLHGENHKESVAQTNIPSAAHQSDDNERDGGGQDD